MSAEVTVDEFSYNVSFPLSPRGEGRKEKGEKGRNGGGRERGRVRVERKGEGEREGAVSYTHLTLPTIRRV